VKKRRVQKEKSNKTTKEESEKRKIYKYKKVKNTKREKKKN